MSVRQIPPNLARLECSDDRSIDKGFGPLRCVLDQTLPLPREPHKLLLMLVKVSVHTVLKVGRSRNLDFGFLFLGKHGGIRASHLHCMEDNGKSNN